MKEDARRWPRIETGLSHDDAVLHYARAVLNVPVPVEIGAIGQHAVRTLRSQIRAWATNVVKDQNPKATPEQMLEEFRAHYPAKADDIFGPEPLKNHGAPFLLMLSALRDGKRVSRLAWKPLGRYLVRLNDRLMVVDNTGNQHEFSWWLTDINATDWIAIEPPPDVHPASNTTDHGTSPTEGQP